MKIKGLKNNRIGGKFYLFLLIFLTNSWWINANIIENKEARQVATNFFRDSFQKTNSEKQDRNLTIEQCYQSPKGVKTPLHIFNNGDHQFAVIAQLSNSYRVIGYSDRNNFESENIPPQVLALIKLYEDAMQIGMVKTASAYGSPVVEPLLYDYDIRLNQYNHPEANNCPTGCVATAVAQIMLYHQGKTGRAIKGYGSHCYMDGATERCTDYENINYSSDSELLSYHVGTAMDMLYCGDVFGSTPGRDFVQPLKNHFHFYTGSTKPDLRFIKNHLDHQRPLYIGFYGEPVNHALVVDGYDNQDFFHLNFGWGGLYNGHYLLNQNLFIANSSSMFLTNVRGPKIISSEAIEVAEQDSIALVAIHNALGGESVTGWNLNDPVFTWSGVVVFDNRVVELSLGTNIPPVSEQSIAPEIGQLTKLEKLYINGCLNGEIPESIFNLSELKELTIYQKSIYIVPTLHKGNLKGTLPANIGNLSNLENLSIFNCLEGNIPSSFGNLSNLKRFHAFQDTAKYGIGGLTGSIPETFGNLSKIEQLNLSNHQLNGNLPASMANWPSVREIDLSGNQLTGSIPGLSHPKLGYLRLNDNQFQGIDEGGWDCPNLVLFEIQNNNISGSVPSVFGTMEKLNRFIISHNQIDSLPESVKNWSYLEDVQLDNNQLISIPLGAANWTYLKNISARNNQIEQLPSNFNFFPYLEKIDFANNQITSIPEDLGNNGVCFNFDFSNNRIENLPVGIDSFRAEAVILLNNNELGGEIPEKLLTRKQGHVRLDYNRFVFSDIPDSEELKFGVRNQKSVSISKKTFPVQLGDTITIDIRKISNLAHSDNDYYWVEYPDFLGNQIYDDRMVGVTEGPVLQLVITAETVNKQYYCKVFNTDSPTFSFEYMGSDYTSPCLYYLNTEPIDFKLASDEELIQDMYSNEFVISSAVVPDHTVYDNLVTLVPPLKIKRGELKWEASSDGANWELISESMPRVDLRENLYQISDTALVLKPQNTAYYRCGIFEDNCRPLYSDTMQVKAMGQVLFDDMINVADTSLTIKVDSIEVTLPKGIHEDDFRLTIIKLDQPPLMPNGVIGGSTYDVTVSFASEFDLPLLIKLNNIDKNRVKAKDIDKIKAVYFDDKNREWKLFDYAHLSLKDSSLNFETDHLTKLSWWWDEETFLWGFTDVYTRNNISVYYKEDDVKIMNDGYGKAQTLQSYHVSGTPWYIQDITQYLHEVMVAFKGDYCKLPVPNKMTVYVQKLKSDDGVVGILGMLNNYITIHRKIANPVKLRSLLAHEFMHYVQDNYISANGGNVFWMEAHAHLSDRMVWNDNVVPISESEHYLLDGRTQSNSIFSFLINSWDYHDRSVVGQKIWGEIDFCYQAGTFLHYMRSYREGTKKLNPATLLKETSWFGSWRAYLNSYIKKHLDSSIGDEYESFVKYILSGSNKNFTILDPEGRNPLSYVISSSAGNVKYLEKKVYDFTKSDDIVKEQVDLKIPYLASKMYYLYNRTPEKDIFVQYKRLHEMNDDYKVYMGRYNPDTKEMDYTDISDSTTCGLILEPKNKEVIERNGQMAVLLFINKKNPGKLDFDNDFNASFELKAIPIINVEDVGMLSIYSGQSPHYHLFDDASNDLIGVGVPNSSYLSNATRFSAQKIGFSKIDTVLNGEKYQTQNRFTVLLDQGFVKNKLTIKDSTIYVQFITQEVFTGKMKIVEKSVNYRIWHTYIEVEKDDKGEVIGEHVVYPQHIHSIDETTKTYELKNCINYLQPETVNSNWFDAYGSNIKVFETMNTSETKNFIEKIDAFYKHSELDMSGVLISTSEKRYESTDYSLSNLKVYLIVHDEP